MATRLYFRNTTAAEPKPNAKQAGTTITQWLASTLGGGQDGSSTTYPCEMSLTAGASNATIGASVTETGAAHYAWVKQFISPPLAAQTISGTFTLVNDFNEGNGLHNMNPYIFIYVWKADDSGSRGTLYAVATSTLEANTTNGSLQTFTFASYTLSSLAISAGDRIVVELMAYDNNTKTAPYDHIIGLNGAVASGYESYIEFSMDLAWNVAPCEAYAAEAILDYEINPCELYAAESILDYNILPTEIYAAEAILDYLGLAEVYAAESILDYEIPPTEVYAAEAILDYIPPTEVYAAEAILDYLGPTEVYAAETILDYNINPCEVYASEAILDYNLPATEVYAAETILDYVAPTEVCAAEGILDYISPSETYAAEIVLDYGSSGAAPCEIYAVGVTFNFLDPTPGGIVTTLTEALDMMVGEDVGLAYASNLTIAGGATDTTAGNVIPCSCVGRLGLLPQATSPSGTSGTLTFNIKVRVNGKQSTTTYQITLTLVASAEAVGSVYLLDVSGFDSVQFTSVVNGDATHQLTAVNVNVRRVGRLTR